MLLTFKFLESYCFVSDALVVGVLLYGVRLALRRSSLAASSRRQIWLGAAITLLTWNSIMIALATRGVFEVRPGTPSIPTIPFAVMLPIAAGLWLLLRSKTIATIVDATPLAWLVGMQSTRVLGVLFLLLMLTGQLPWQFALPAGVGDVVVGLSAISIARAAQRGVRVGQRAVYGWNLLGLLDFVVALATGFLTSPSPLQRLAFDHPNLLALQFPLVMIPAFLVPLYSLLHGICLWKMRRMAKTPL
jgi:hypothetical protein